MRTIALLALLLLAGCVAKPNVVHPMNNKWRGATESSSHSKEIIERLDRIETLLEKQRSKNAD